MLANFAEQVPARTRGARTGECRCSMPSGTRDLFTGSALDFRLLHRLSGTRCQADSPARDLSASRFGERLLRLSGWPMPPAPAPGPAALAPAPAAGF